MKTKISVLIIAALFCSLSYSQTITIPADQLVDFSMVEQTQDLKYAFEGQYHVEDFDLHKTMPKKGSPVVKGALIGLGVGAGAGLLAGAVSVAALKDSFNLLGGTSADSWEGATILVFTLGGAGLGALTGTLVGLGVNAGRKNKADQPKYPEAIEYKTPEPQVRNMPAVPEVQIISLSHSF